MSRRRGSATSPTLSPFYRSNGIEIQRLHSDNGSNYRSNAFALALRVAGLRHSRSRAYRPQTNGKAERSIRTVTEGWAYGAIYGSSAELTAALTGWLERYNSRRPRLTQPTHPRQPHTAAKPEQRPWPLQLVLFADCVGTDHTAPHVLQCEHAARVRNAAGTVPAQLVVLRLARAVSRFKTRGSQDRAHCLPVHAEQEAAVLDPIPLFESERRGTRYGLARENVALTGPGSSRPRRNGCSAEQPDGE